MYCFELIKGYSTPPESNGCQLLTLEEYSKQNITKQTRISMQNSRSCYIYINSVTMTIFLSPHSLERYLMEMIHNSMFK